jgi:hypothetical protein
MVSHIFRSPVSVTRSGGTQALPQRILACLEKASLRSVFLCSRNPYPPHQMKRETGCILPHAHNPCQVWKGSLPGVVLLPDDRRWRGGATAGQDPHGWHSPLTPFVVGRCSPLSLALGLSPAKEVGAAGGAPPSRGRRTGVSLIPLPQQATDWYGLWSTQLLSVGVTLATMEYLDEFAFRCSHRQDLARLVDLVLGSC